MEPCRPGAQSVPLLPGMPRACSVCHNQQVWKWEWGGILAPLLLIQFGMTCTRREHQDSGTCKSREKAPCTYGTVSIILALSEGDIQSYSALLWHGQTYAQPMCTKEPSHSPQTDMEGAIGASTSGFALMWSGGYIIGKLWLLYLPIG